ncbi:MAG: hypothetical protein KDD25_00925 [Bdellovibrionales bacterium]|nr:hypothetical protein [Bdellovibrionales bacterium]
MKVSEVPQDLDEGYEGQKKIRYALNENGEYVKVPSQGWSVEKQATELAWDDIRHDLKSTLEDVKNGKQSPLAYHMKLRLLEPALLAPNLGLWVWQVKRHLKPKVFNKLKPELLKKYSEYLDISVEDLKSVPEER